MQVPIAIFVLLILISLSGGISSDSDDDVVTTAKQSDERLISEVPDEDSSVTAAIKINSDTSNNDSYTAAVINNVQEVQIVELALPSIESAQVLNIEENSATVRTSVNMNSYEDGLVFLVYGYSLREVSLIMNQYDKFTEVPEATSDEVRTLVLDSRANADEGYERRVSALVPRTDYFFRICIEYQTSSSISEITCTGTESFSTNPDDPYYDRFNVPRISLDRAVGITAGGAVLGSSVNMNDAVDGIVFIVYGQSQELIKNVEDLDEYTDVEEFDEYLQKVRLAVRVRGRATYVYEADDLDNDTIYYYRVCVDYGGEEDGVTCSYVKNFTTDSRNRNTLPSIKIQVSKVATEGVTFISSARMNDFNDGIAFMVYGTNEGSVDGVSDIDSFSRIRQGGDQLQKNILDIDLDGNDSYTTVIKYLLPATEYFYRACIEYEDEDNYNRPDTFLKCSATQSMLSL